MISNPFSVYDVVSLNVGDLYPIEYNKYNEKLQQDIIEKNNRLKDLFRHKEIRILKEGKYMDFKVVGTTRLVIEYHCEIVEEKD